MRHAAARTGRGEPIRVNHPPFLSETNDASRRRAVFEDNGVAAYVYLLAPDSKTIVADAWVYNRIAAPAREDIRKFQPGPPPAADGYVAPEGRVPTPEAYAWSFTWSVDGEAVAICADGVPLAFVRADHKRGFSRHLTRSGPWGEPWSEGIYASTFGTR